MKITGSPDITLLSVQVTWDLSGVNPVINLTNLSQGANLKLCSWAFTAYSPSLTPIHLGSIDYPDISPSSSSWVSFSLTDAWPRNPFNSSQIEWSGDTYKFFVTVKDSVGNVYTTADTELQQVFITPPPGVSSDWLSFYGVASSNVAVKCNEGAVFFQDTTNHIYNGNAGSKVSSSLILSYPADDLGNRQTNFELINYSSALAPVTINSPAYQFIQNAVYDYNYLNNIIVRLRFNLNGTFGVWCGINLLPLVNVINKYFYKIQNNEFVDIASAQKRGILILAEYSLVITGVLQPLAGACDIPDHIRKIEALTGFSCFDACCGGSSGITPQQMSSVIGGYNFVVNSLGGDIAGNFSTNGNNIILNIGDVRYIVDVTSNSPSDITAIDVVPEVRNDHLTYYHIRVNGNQLATELANVIKSNGDVYNLWYALFGGNNNGNFKLIVDGGCIFQSSSSCNFTFRLYNIPADTTFANLTSIKIGTSATALVYLFNLSNLSGLQTYLNSLALGTFNVVNSGGGVVTITSNTNTNNITALTYKLSASYYIADMDRVCTGFVPIDANDAVQRMINYICNLTDNQIATSQEYTICYLDSTGTQQTSVVSLGQDISVFIEALLAAGCSTVSYIKSSGAGGGVNCDNMTSLFKTTTAKVDANTLLYGNKTGCAGITPAELFQYMLTISDEKTKQLFCNFVASCGAGLSCESVSYDVIVTPYNNSCSSIVGIKYTVS